MDERFECCRYEPSLEDLLADEVMTPVLRSAGLEAREFREMMVETARRIEDRARQRDKRVRSSRPRPTSAVSGIAAGPATRACCPPA